MPQECDTYKLAMRASAVIILCIIAASAGCGDGTMASQVAPASVLEITTNQTTYTAGAHGTTVARNKSAREVLMNLCPWELDRWTDEGWVVAATGPDDGLCLPVLSVVQPGQSAQRPFQLPLVIEPGQSSFGLREFLTRQTSSCQ